ncbi:methylmalonyl-CoA mutase subunit beta [Marixanthomonas spongiae]|uniref:Methylmalonyl-CoA mutase n=1 Tax=Marixanthomonas spongiae TaxID=2174845 RepID=A0A2U0I0U5_9FLAO|nr:methylmalonyl-CoA mutase subunit beta [Marixanthomonas spongiae]PVW14620.1 methylmalonyl-CoA mutase [Marixanthomonas spongiae]
MSDLFKEFAPVSAKEWKQKIQADLKGADYNESLVWQSPEGIHVKPFYHPDDFENPFPPISGQPTTWNIAQHIFIDDEAVANKLALDAVERGAEAIILSAEKKFAIEKVFKNFPFEETPIYFNLTFFSEEFLLHLKSYLSKKNATVHYNIDIIGNLTRTGNWFHNLKEDHRVLEKFVSENPSEAIISIDTTGYQNAGATIMQQLAYALAHANEYLNHFENVSLSPSINSGQAKVEGATIQQSLQITFKLAVGSNYFFEIAKIRALRKGYAALASEYGFSETCHIMATPSKRNKTLYDYNTNMLRTTTECMSAILGGADIICNLPYDALYHKSNEFGERISRNQLLVLKEESYFDTVSNAADGTYYIESLTDDLAEKALELFKSIEKGGGFLKQLKEGKIQQKIKESAEKEQQLFNQEELKLVGTNYHTNPEDRMKNAFDLYPFVKIKPRKTIIAPIIEKRLAEQTEQERLKQENNG